MEASLVTAAALIALAGALFHGVVGGKIYMGHIKASELMPLTQSLSLVSWQMFTVFLVVSGATLLCVAMKPDLAYSPTRCWLVMRWVQRSFHYWALWVTPGF